MTDRLPERAGPVPARNASVPLGVVFERRRIVHPWAEWRRKPGAPDPGPAGRAEAAAAAQSDGRAGEPLAAPQPQPLRREAPDHRLNPAQPPALVYVLWRSEASMPDNRPEPF